MFDVRYYTDTRGNQPVAEYLRQAERTGDASVEAAFGRVIDRLAAQGSALPTAYSVDVPRGGVEAGTRS